MTRKPLALALLAVLSAGSAAAWDGITLQAITADVDFDLFVDPMPTPACWHYWAWEASGNDVLTLHQTYGIDVGICTRAWLLHCDTDSLSWHGSWAEIDPDDYLWNWLIYDVVLSSRVYIWEPARLLARRTVTGELSTDIHAVEVVPSVGDPMVMLAADGGPDEARSTWNRDVYTLILRVSAREHGTHYAYDGRVHLTWEPQGGSPVQLVTWSTIKALYE